MTLQVARSTDVTTPGQGSQRPYVISTDQLWALHDAMPEPLKSETRRFPVPIPNELALELVDGRGKAAGSDHRHRRERVAGRLVGARAGHPQSTSQTECERHDDPKHLRAHVARRRRVRPRCRCSGAGSTSGLAEFDILRTHCGLERHHRGVSAGQRSTWLRCRSTSRTLPAQLATVDCHDDRRLTCPDSPTDR